MNKWQKQVNDEMALVRLNKRVMTVSYVVTGILFVLSLYTFLSVIGGV
jgi:hypothetical protein